MESPPAPATAAEPGQRTPTTSAAAKKPGKGEDSRDLQALLSKTRDDLIEAQKSRGELVTKHNKTTEELEKLKKKAGLEARKLADVAVERTQLQSRLKDRDEELKGKAKLLDVSVRGFCPAVYSLLI